ncbi:MAG: Hsp70 family protein [Methylovulum sp.]|uniref:Hsp70 family protein n=1 Tax=Methylovulum sp. TaxID=1916980 RepID=UPI00260F4F08|nr:Hsp70 family protein [Methylovulum sp.]MDD2723675.1 Hsp70 family protein [Methylovulum sp.]MDD5123351.1 Hsp70 family protein [Methylovulum sp.]
MSLFDHIKKIQENLQETKPEATPVITAPAAEPETPAPSQSENSQPETPQTSVQPTESAPAFADPIIEPVQTQANSDGQHFAVGIDLGTTHCVLSYSAIGLADDEFSQQVMAIPQLTAPGMVEDNYQLPSFLYQAHEAELAEGSTALPWTAKPDFLVGEIARNLGSKTPIRLVASAKSWLCHAGVDCKAPILPADSPEEVTRVSPFQASVAYLQHLRDAWQHLHPNAPLSEQDLVITVPASFDPAARELTVEAARTVGLHQAILLEEPQAAVYSWIEKSQGDWRKQVNCGDIILIVDIGGGTTDLSLIAVTQQDGNLELTRVAVGDHILLGGDNMDLALAYTVKAKLEKDGQRLQPWQIQALTHGCRDAKEKLFTDNSTDTIPLVVANRGSSLIGGTLRTELTREEVNRVLVEGFLPTVAISDRPVSRTRAGLRTAGLPYAQDAGITRHLAAFLSKQQYATSDLPDVNLPEHATFLHPSAVLFNGGVLKANALAERLMQILNSWLIAEQAPEARLLAGADLDLAVARGAAYYGFVRKGRGVRIKGGTAASYYVGIESAMPAVPGLPPELEALCIAPFGMEEGTQAELPDDEFGLVIGEPVRFRFFASNSRREDPVGTRLDYWSDDELSELAEIEITLPEAGRRPGEVIPVHLCAAVTEVGTLELHAVSQKDDGRWKIEFDVRAGEN